MVKLGKLITDAPLLVFNSADEVDAFFERKRKGIRDSYEDELIEVRERYHKEMQQWLAERAEAMVQFEDGPE